MELIQRLSAPAAYIFAPRSLKAIAGVVFLFGALFYHVYAKAPQEFPAARLVAVPDGASVQSIAAEFAEQGIIRAPRLFSALVRLRAPGSGVIAGDYSFPRALSVFGVVRSVTDPMYGESLLRVTIPEGLHNREIADLLENKLVGFDRDEFLRLADPYEGYLFPDTYFLTRTTPAGTIVELMRENFDERIAEIQKAFDDSDRSLHEIVTMASLLEKEARTKSSRRSIAGILWKRLDDGMRLQVDAAFLYFLGRSTFDLTLEDLRYDSPYNTYKYAGLPPAPINNPGLAAIEAAATPLSSPYWFYLSDRGGEFHYAVTFDEHKENKRRYLR